jgi:hypothetical protein
MRIVWFSAFVLWIVALTGCTTCKNVPLQHRVAPSRLSAANVVARTCGQASGFAVTLTEGNAPILNGDIPSGKTLFWTFVPQGADSSSAAFAEQISVRWVTPVKLHIAYANWMTPTVKELRHGTVEVEYEITSTPLP